MRAEAQSSAYRPENGCGAAGVGDLGTWRIAGEPHRAAVRNRSRIVRALLAGAAGIALIAFVAAIQPEQQLPNATGIKLTAEQETSPAEGRGPVAIDVDDDNTDDSDQSQDLLDQASQQHQENEQQDELNQQQSEQTEDEDNQAAQQDEEEEDQSLMQLDEQDAGEQ